MCGFVWYPITDYPAVSLLYEDAYFAGTEYPDYLGQENALRKSMRRHLSQMARFSPLEGKLLEVGCAYGLFLDEARLHFDQVVGVDVCANPVSHACKQIGVDARCGNFLRMEFGAQRFNVVCLWDTIEHLPTPGDFLKKAAELIVDGGMLYITTGDISAAVARMRGRHWRQIHPPTHVSYFSRETLSKLLRLSGFTVVGIETASYYHTLFNILASIRLRRGVFGGVASGLLSMLGEGLARRFGIWLNLGDIMFVAARRIPTTIPSRTQ
ncbi:MAG: class I SAM-dependent methyltransferase [Gemmatimonadaceae bacterium]|nr:class I SAM-dependent methyltransferase [Gemmatimonadaceae bacterium]